MLLPAGDGADVIVGIRSNELEAVDLLRRRLDGFLIDDVVSSTVRRTANISVKFGEQREGERDAHVIVRSGFEARRTFSRDTAIDTAISLLHTYRPTPAGATILNARFLVRDESVIVVGDTFGAAIDAQHRMLTKAGFTIAAHSPVWVDVNRCEALLPSSTTLADDRLARLPISHVVAFAPPVLSETPPSVLLSHLTPLVAGRTGPTSGDDLQALATLWSTCDIVRLEYTDSKRVAQALIQL